MCGNNSRSIYLDMFLIIIKNVGFLVVVVVVELGPMSIRCESLHGCTMALLCADVQLLNQAATLTCETWDLLLLARLLRSWSWQIHRAIRATLKYPCTRLELFCSIVHFETARSIDEYSLGKQFGGHRSTPNDHLKHRARFLGCQGTPRSHQIYHDGIYTAPTCDKSEVLI